MNCIKVAIADDHEKVADSLRFVLSNDKAFEVVLIAKHGKDLLDQLESTKPDIVIMDISMPVMDGIEASKIIQKKYPFTKIIAYSFFDNEKNIIEMNKAGVKSFVGKGSPVSEIFKAIRIVHGGGVYFPDDIADVLQKFLAKSEEGETILLSDTEKLLLEALSKGWTSKQIAEVIHKSPRTIDEYRIALYEKFGVESKEELLVKASKLGNI